MCTFHGDLQSVSFVAGDGRVKFRIEHEFEVLYVKLAIVTMAMTLMMMVMISY